MTQSELYTYARRLVHANSTDWSESDLVVDLNDALSDVWVRIKNARGVLEFDDSNHTDLSAGTFDLAAGTSTYKVTEDENANEIYTIHKVAVKTENGDWVDIPRKRLDETEQDDLLDDANDTSGMPTSYYEMGNNVIFSPIPDRSGDESVKIWYDREPKRFEAGGSLTVGIPDLYHPLLAEKASLKYAIINNLNQAGNLQSLVQMGEERIDEYEGHRRRDEAGNMTPANHATR